MTGETKQTRKYGLVGFGLCAVDEVVVVPRFPEPDSKMPVTRMERHVGGLCSIALVAAARLGVRCAYAGLLGRNELSDFVRATLRQEGIEIAEEIRYAEAEPVHSVILLPGDTGERTILFYSGGVRAFVAEDIPEELIAESSVLMVDQGSPAGTLYACKLARKCGTATVADFERGEHEDLRAMMPYVDHLILPLQTARELTGCAAAAEAVAQLADGERACTAVTDGTRGCWYVEGAGAVRHQPCFPVQAVDTTGCGDVFHGAYAAALVKGKTVYEAIPYAAAAAALRATARGGQAAIPYEKAVEEFMVSQRPC
jgi:sugar/nucleoside kinase (ribokinase family)